MAPPDTSASALQALLKRLWIHGFLAGVGVLFAVLLSCYFIWGWPFATPECPEESKPTPAQASLGSSGDPNRRPPSQPRRLLSARLDLPPASRPNSGASWPKLEEANQKRDLQQLLSLYAPSFPDSPRKAQRDFPLFGSSDDYLSLNFKLDSETNRPTPDSASALVTWKIKTRQRQTHQIKDTTKVYLVSFTRESGQWRIKSLEKVGKLANQDKSP